jgi:hypothetical protein
LGATPSSPAASAKTWLSSSAWWSASSGPCRRSAKPPPSRTSSSTPHVVRHVYAFELDAERVERLASRLQPTFGDAKAALIAFAAFLEGLAHVE